MTAVGQQCTPNIPNSIRDEYVSKMFYKRTIKSEKITGCSDYYEKGWGSLWFLSGDKQMCPANFV